MYTYFTIFGIWLDCDPNFQVLKLPISELLPRFHQLKNHYVYFLQITTEFNDLEKDEVNIISGALELRKKTVGEVMTKIEDVYMLSYDTILDFETVSEIMKSGMLFYRKS